MPPRFFVPSAAIGAPPAPLPPDERHHLLKVLRLGTGDEVHVFDGQGHEYLARIEQSGRDDVRVHILERVDSAPEPAVALTLAQAVLKGDRMDDVVRDAVMMGAAAVHPIVSTRSETTVAAIGRGHRVDRWERIVLASVKQCGRAVLPEVLVPLSFEDFLREPAGELRLMAVEPGVSSDEAIPISQLRTRRVPSSAELLVGPEGGWTPGEVRLAVSLGVEPVTFGRRTLRADAVAVAAIAVLQCLWGDL